MSLFHRKYETILTWDRHCAKSKFCGEMLSMKTLLWKLFAKCRKVWVRCKFVSNIYLGFCNDVLKIFLYVLEVFYTQLLA